MEKFLESLEKAEKTIRTVDHIVYVTFPLVNDKKLLLKILLELKGAVANCINAILQYEYLYKRISLYKDAKSNFRVFRERCAERYGITEEEIKLVLNLFELAQKHKESGFEFVRDEKVVILGENLRTETITIEKMKEFLGAAKNILEKTKTRFLSKI